MFFICAFLESLILLTSIHFPFLNLIQLCFELINKKGSQLQEQSSISMSSNGATVTLKVSDAHYHFVN